MLLHTIPMANLPTLSQISAIHASIYEAYFKEVDTKGKAIIPALQAATFLKKSGLKQSYLSQIWELADSKGKGSLDKQGFFVALKLIALVQNGHEASINNLLISTPAPKMGSSNKGSLSNNVSPTDDHNSDWAINENEKVKYEKIFNSMSPVNGLLPGSKVKPVLLNSKLPKDTLGRIWDLSDIDKDGNLDKEEFILAMHLVYDCLAKNSLPPSLPLNMVPPSKRKVGMTPPPILNSINLERSSKIPSSTNHSPLVQTHIDTSHPLSKDAWVICPNLKMQFDELFARTDRDKDGFVSGIEIKSVFLKSGIPQNTLAKI